MACTIGRFSSVASLVVGSTTLNGGDVITHDAVGRISLAGGNTPRLKWEGNTMRRRCANGKLKLFVERRETKRTRVEECDFSGEGGLARIVTLSGPEFLRKISRLVWPMPSCRDLRSGIFNISIE
jgi:hypothetical protein